jgi:ribosomal protein S11
LRRPSLYDKYVSKKFINKRGLWVPPRRWKRLSYKVKNLVKNIKRYKFIKSIKKSQKLHITRGDNRALPYKKTLLELMSKYGINNLNKKNSFIRLKKRLAILKRKSKLYSYNRFSRSSLYSKKWYKKRLSNNYDILNTKVISNIRKSFFKRNNIYSYSIRLKRTLLKRKLNRSLFPRVRTSSPFILRRYHKIKNAINSYAYYKNGFSAYKLMGIGLKSMSNARLPKLNRYKKRGKKRYKKHNKKYELDYKSDYSKFNIKFISKEGKPILFKNSYPESIKSKSVNNYRVLSRKRIAYNIKKRIKSIKYHIRRSIYKNYHKPYLFNKAIKFKYRFGKYRLLLHKGKKYDPRFWNRLEGSKFSHKIRLYRGLFDSLAKVHLLRGINKKYDYNMGKGLYSPLNLLGFKKYHPYRFLRHRALFPRLINNSSYKRIKDYSLYKKVLALRPLINRLNALHMFIRKHNYSYKLSNNKILNDYLVKFNKYNYENNGLIRLYKQNIINYNLLKGINRLMWSRSGATPSSLYHYNSLSERLNYNKIKLNKRNFYYSNSRLYRTKSRLNKKPKLLSQGTRRRWRGLNKRLRWVKRYGYRPKNPFRRLYKRWWRIRGKYELSKKDNKPLSLLSLNNGYPTLMLKSFVNNFIIQVLDKNGKSLTMKTAGSIYEGPQRRTWFAAQNIAFLIGQYLLGRNIKNINVCFRSKFSKHMIEAAKSLMTTTTLIKSKVYDEELGIKRTKNLIRRLRVIGFSILYKRSHNGLRAKKARRV